MSSFSSFQERVLEVSRTSFHCSNVEEAREAIKLCKLRIKDLRQIKKEVNLEIKTIRNAYKEHMNEAGSKNHTIMGAVFGRSTSGRIRAENKRKLTIQRNDKIEPFESLKISIDDLVTQIESGKIEFEEVINESKSSPIEKTSEKPAETKGNDVFDQIEKLGDLRKKNYLSEEEFQSKKNELLSKI